MKKTRISSPMEDTLRPTIDTRPGDTEYNRAGHVVEYRADGRSMRNQWEPSYPQSLGYEGWPSDNPQYTLGNVAGKKAAEGFATDPRRETAPGASGVRKGKE